jgi:hypothetical protein
MLVSFGPLVPLVSAALRSAAASAGRRDVAAAHGGQPCRRHVPTEVTVIACLAGIIVSPLDARPARVRLAAPAGLKRSAWRSPPRRLDHPRRLCPIAWLAAVAGWGTCGALRSVRRRPRLARRYRRRSWWRPSRQSPCFVRRLGSQLEGRTKRLR